MTQTEALARFIQTHASIPENYESGWSFVVECYEVADLVTIFDEAGVTTEAEAIEHFGFSVDVFHDRYLDAKNSAF